MNVTLQGFYTANSPIRVTLRGASTWCRICIFRFYCLFLGSVSVYLICRSILDVREFSSFVKPPLLDRARLGNSPGAGYVLCQSRNPECMSEFTNFFNVTCAVFFIFNGFFYFIVYLQHIFVFYTFVFKLFNIPHEVFNTFIHLL